MMDIGALKTAHDLHNSVDLANVTEELVAESFARARASDQSGNIDKLDRRRDDFLRMRHLCQDIEPRVGNDHNADVWVDGAEGIILCRRFVRSGDGIKKRGFPNVRQADNSSAEHKRRRIIRTVAAVYLCVVVLEKRTVEKIMIRQLVTELPADLQSRSGVIKRVARHCDDMSLDADLSQTPKYLSLAPILSNYLKQSFRIRDVRCPEFGKYACASKLFATT